MTNVLKLTKKIFTVGVVATTIVWSLGVAALVPGVANAATCPTLSAGEMVKVAGKAAIYVLDNNLKPRYFDNGDVFKSWRPTYGGYTTITMDCLDSLGMAAMPPFGVTYHPGSYVVRSASSDQLYVVRPNNVLSKITPALATTLYGTGYKVMTISVQDWPNYSRTGADITEAKAHEGMLVKNGGKTWYVGAGTLQEVTEAGMIANGFQTKFVRTVADSVVAGLTTGTPITAEVKALSDKSQSGGVVAGTVTPVSGSVTVSLAADTPASQSGLPKGTANVDVLKFNVTNSGSSDMTIDELTIKRGGTGEVTGLTAYIYDGETRVGTGKTFASDSNEAYFSVMNKVVKAGTTLPLIVRLSLSTSITTGNHVFSVNSMKLAAGTVAGLPVTGNLMSTNSGITAGSITIASNGTLSAPVVGDVGATVAQFKLTAGTEDVDVKSFTLKQDGTLSTDLLSNFVLYQGSTILPSTVVVNGRLVTFTLTSPLRILNGANKILTVKADVSGAAESGKGITFFMDNDNDLKAVGASYGYGVSLTRGSYDAAGDTSSYPLLLLGGGVTISNKSLAAHDVKVDSTEVELGKVAITAKSDTVEIQKMTLNIATTKVASSSANTGDWGLYRDVNDDATMDSGDTILLRNIKLKDVDTGRTIGSAKAITDCATITADTGDVDTALVCTYTDYFNIAKGATKNIIAVADINTAQISGVKYTATFDFSSNSVFVIKDSKDVAVTDIVPASTISSNAITTRSSALTISRATTPESRTVVKNSTVDALGMIFAAGSGTGNDVKLTGLTLNVYVDNGDTTAGTFADTTEGTVDANELVTEVSLYVGDTKIAGPASVDTSGNVVFTSSKFVGGYYTIPAGTSKTVVARTTVSGNAPYGSVDDAFAFTFAAADVTVEDGTGTTFTPTVTGTNLNGTTSPTVAITITAGGTITSSADNGKPLAQVIKAGLASEQEVSRIKLASTKETFTVDKLAVGVSSGAATFDNVEYIRLYDTNGVALSEGVNLDANGTSTFTGLNIQVPVAGTTVIVKAKLNAIGERSVATVATAGVGSDTGDTLTFALSTVDGDFHAQGASGTVDTQADAAASNTFQVVKSAPTVTVLSLPSTVLASDTVTIFKFSVTADANEDVTLARITPYITFSDSDSGNELNMSAATLKVYDMSAPSTALNTADNALSSTTGAFGINFTTSTALPTIGKGTTKTFEVRADFVGVETSDSVSVKFVQDAGALATAATVVGTGAQATTGETDATLNRFIWSDNSADTDAFTSTEWMNSYLLPNWDTKSLSVSKS